MTSLRRDIHSAFEVIEPPLGGMPERVVQTVLAERNGRLRKEEMVYRFRISLALVAAVLLVAVGAAAVMTWNSLHRNNLSPAGSTQTITVQQLESRPLQLHLPQSPSSCHSGPFNAEHDFGPGPAYVGGAPTVGSAWGDYAAIHVYSDKVITGPILIRARDLYKNVFFVFTAPYGAGPVLGDDVVDGATVEHHPEAVVDENRTSPNDGKHRYSWQVTAAIAKGWSGSMGWQIDGQGFTEVFYAC